MPGFLSVYVFNASGMAVSQRTSKSRTNEWTATLLASNVVYSLVESKPSDLTFAMECTWKRSIWNYRYTTTSRKRYCSSRAKRSDTAANDRYRPGCRQRGSHRNKQAGRKSDTQRQTGENSSEYEMSWRLHFALKSKPVSWAILAQLIRQLPRRPASWAASAAAAPMLAVCNCASLSAAVCNPCSCRVDASIGCVCRLLRSCSDWN